LHQLPTDFPRFSRLGLLPPEGESKNAPAMSEPAAEGIRGAPTPAPRALPSKSLAFVCALHAVPLVWATLTLPWQRTSWFAMLVGALALLHVAVAAVALFRRPRALEILWQVLAAFSLLVLVAVTCVVAGSALYLAELYRGIGRAIAAALFGVWGLFVLFTVPVSAWGLACTKWPRWALRRRVRTVAAVTLLGLAIATLFVARSARAEPVRVAQPETVETALVPRVRSFFAAFDTAQGERPISLFHEAPARCAHPVDPDRLTLLVTYADRAGEPRAACLQAAEPGSLVAALDRLLHESARAGHAFKLDLVEAIHPLQRSHDLLDALKVRPGVDGVCAGERCFAPWQLVTLDAFTQYHPLDAVRDASFGCAFDQLSGLLHVDPNDPGLVRIQTRSMLARDGALVPLRRLRPKHISQGVETKFRAMRDAEKHIVDAQEDNGGFRYLLDPFRSASSPTGDPVNLPRQAGTTLVLCELGRGAGTRRAALRALDQLATYERKGEGLSALSLSSGRAQLGHSALPLIAFASCRGWARERHDRLIGDLTRLVLAMQRDDGSFAPELVLRTARTRGAHAPLYATGQAVLALVLVDQLAAERPGGPLPSREVLGRAIERAMGHYARDYWPSTLRPLFFLEENWHCLAARAALASRRHDAYEQFCLDYVAFKTRLILDASDGVDDEHVGGYSLSNMLPPHSTPTAGFGEALAAAIQVKRARGMDVAAERALMTRVLDFLVRQQWTRENCFACAEGAVATGGFSESSASPMIRIDYVQHAMAAIGHGSKLLGLL
jgi:hypothetical protein